MKSIVKVILLFVFQVLFMGLISGQVPGQSYTDTLSTSFFVKTEINTGLRFYRNNGRESLNTGFSENSEKRANNILYYNFEINSWKFLSDRQESFNILAGIGPVYSTGESSRETTTITTTFDNKLYGPSVSGNVNYSGRYYYDDKNYALAEVYGFGKFEKLWVNSEGR
ncbi:MAG: hypothetical protein JW833_05590, partial [Prolixibacteraceae bacterium]|nr:hypothetical protein [Prolixibacteraceae bacterium]